MFIPEVCLLHRWNYFFIVTLYFNRYHFRLFVHPANIYWMLIRCWNTKDDMKVLALMEFIPVGSRVDWVSDEYWNLGCALKETIQGWQREMEWGGRCVSTGIAVVSHDILNPPKVVVITYHHSVNYSSLLLPSQWKSSFKIATCNSCLLLNVWWPWVCCGKG